MESIRSKKFKSKNDKIEPPTQYLGGGLTTMVNDDSQSCWAMSSDTYCAALVKTVEGVLEKKGHRLLSKCRTPLTHGYRPELNATAELNQMVFNGTKKSLVCFARWKSLYNDVLCVKQLFTSVKIF